MVHVMFFKPWALATLLVSIHSALADVEKEVLQADVCHDADCGLSALQLRGDRRAGVSSEAPAEGSLGPVSQHSKLSFLELLEGRSRQGSKFCSTYNGEQCRLLAGCKDPNSECYHSHCRCKPGFCAQGGGCVSNEPSITCFAFTKGTCRIKSCEAGRGPTVCRDSLCYCQDGYCADDDGICRMGRLPFNVEVVRVLAPRERAPGIDDPAKITAARNAFPPGHNQVQRALCLSGGGARAMAMAMGVLRALTSLNLIAQIDALSSNSGGSWAAAVYMFQTSVADNVLLGDATVPGALTRAALQIGNPRRLAVGATRDITEIASRMYRNEGVLGSQLWVSAVAEAMLQPFGLASKEKFMAGSVAQATQIITNNPGQGWDVNNPDQSFFIPAANRPPLWVCVGTVLAPYMYLATKDNVVPYQISPDYSGVPMYPTPKGVVSYPGKKAPLRAVVGGGMIETFAVGSDAPKDGIGQSGTPAAAGQVGAMAKVAAPPDPMSLAKAIGISSTAHAMMIPGKKSLKGSKLRRLSPKATLWPVTRDFTHYAGDKTGALRFTLGDGGVLENLGLLPMLQRGATRLLVAAAMDKSLRTTYKSWKIFSRQYEFCPLGGVPPLNSRLRREVTKVISGQILSPFGLGKVGKIKNDEAGNSGVNDKVFETEAVWPLLCQFFTKLQAGQPPVVHQRLQLLRNDWWGIEGGYLVDVVWVFNAPYRNFQQQLPEESRRGQVNLATSRRLGNTAYTWEEINFIAANAEWSVRDKAQLITDLFDPNAVVADNPPIVQGGGGGGVVQQDPDPIENEEPDLVGNDEDNEEDLLRSEDDIDNPAGDDNQN